MCGSLNSQTVAALPQNLFRQASAMTASVIACLARLADRLPELGADGEWAAGWLRIYLDPFGSCSLDEALGLPRDWRAAARRLRRDQAIGELAAYFATLSRARQAAEVHRLLCRYASTRWHRIDRARAKTPAAYFGRPEAHLFAALRAGGGAVPGPSRIRQILASHCGASENSDNPSPLAIVNAASDNADYATST